MTTMPATTGYLWRGQPGLARINAQIMAERAGMPRQPQGTVQHGTVAGYRRHRRHSEKACEACRQAETRRYQDRMRKRRQTAG